MLELPDKPSIAVLPLANLSDDPQQEYFSDGMTEDLITALSKISGLFVIARTSVFTYKGKPVKVQQVSQDLGVRYVLEGSVRKAAERVRITAQLIDATTGTHLWAERYDRVLEDVFTVQDEITRNIVTALEVQLTSGEQVRLWRQGTTNPEAYDTFLRGRDQAMRKTREDTVQARRLFERAIELDPGFAMAYVGLASTFTLEVRLGWSPSLAESLERARALTHKAIALDDALADAYAQLGYIALLQRQHAPGHHGRTASDCLEPQRGGSPCAAGRHLELCGQARGWAGHDREGDASQSGVSVLVLACPGDVALPGRAL